MIKKTWQKYISLIVAIFMIASFAMSTLSLHAEGTTVTTITTGSAFNAAIKELSGNTAVTAFEHASEIPSTAATKDISSSGDSSIVVWLDKTTVKWYSSAATIYLNPDCRNMFSGLTALQSVGSFYPFDSSKVTNTSNMFAGDTSISSLDLTSLTTTSVTNMESMFSGMTSLTSLNIGNFDTANVTDMTDMFMNDTALTALDLSSFKVTYDATAGSTAVNTAITDMFKNDAALKSIYVGYDWQADITADTRLIRVYTTTFNQTLLMDSQANIKDITFSYTMTPGTMIEGSTGVTYVKAGLMDTDCSVSSTSFGNTTPSSSGTPSNASFAGKKYMTQVAKVLIDTRQFTEPGIYRYIISEATELTGEDIGLFTLDEQKTRVLDVLAEYKDGQNLIVSSSVLHNNAVNLTGTTLDSSEKSSGYANLYLLSTNDLVIRNKVSGNQSDMLREFTYTFNVSGDIAYRNLTVILPDGKVTTIPINADKNGALEFTLKGTEKLTVRDIQKGASYTITSKRDSLALEGIDVTVETTSTETGYGNELQFYNDTKTDTNDVVNSAVSENVDITFTNVKNGIVPTGVIVDTAPYLLSVLLGSFGILLIQAKKQRDSIQNENED